MRPTRPITSMAVVVVAGALALAGCGGGSSNSSTSSGSSSGGSGSSSSGSSGSSSSSGGGQTLQLAADPTGKLAFDKKTLDAKAGTLTIAFTNKSGVPHAVEIEGHGAQAHTQTITDGSNSLTADLKPGKYTFFCPVPGHRQAGMVGTLVVK